MPWPRLHRSATRRPHAGQALIFILVTLVILFFVVLWNVDLHKTLHVKMLSQNGGDAAAMAAARWQGISLNLVGDLNLAQALALSASDPDTVAAISNLQAHVAIAGPMIGFMAAQQAAKNNNIYPNEDFTRMLREHAAVVRNEYTRIVGNNGEMAVPEPYVGAWEEYAAMLDLAVADGVAVGPDNARFVTDYTGDHILLDPAFYEAVAGRNWCWFYDHAPGLLDSYTDHTGWPPLPQTMAAEYINSEIFGLGVMRLHTSLGAVVDPSLVGDLASERGFGGRLTDTGITARATWYAYGELWTAWDALSQDGEDPFPAVGPVRPQYDYAGADAAVRVISRSTRLTPGPRGVAVSNVVTWTAAAKAFGYLGEADPPHSYGIVLPAFHEARLIPLDASSASPGGSFDPEWRRFIEEDLPVYLATGDYGSSYYGTQLQTFDDPAFRQDGIDWLAEHSDECTAGGPGSGPGGGRRRGH